MKRVITYGTFDLIHFGHYRLLERAKALGDYLIVGVTSDKFDEERGKSKEQLLEDRINAVKSLNLADEIVVENYNGQKLDDIKKYDIDLFVIGSDWEGKFDYLREYCEVIYLPRTEGISSTKIRMENGKIRVFIEGESSLVDEAVSNLSKLNGIELTEDYESADAVYSLLGE